MHILIHDGNIKNGRAEKMECSEKLKTECERARMLCGSYRRIAWHTQENVSPTYKILPFLLMLLMCRVKLWAFRLTRCVHYTQHTCFVHDAQQHIYRNHFVFMCHFNTIHSILFTRRICMIYLVPTHTHTHPCMRWINSSLCFSAFSVSKKKFVECFSKISSLWFSFDKMSNILALLLRIANGQMKKTLRLNSIDLHGSKNVCYEIFSATKQNNSFSVLSEHTFMLSYHILLHTNVISRYSIFIMHSNFRRRKGNKIKRKKTANSIQTATP